MDTLQDVFLHQTQALKDKTAFQFLHRGEYSLAEPLIYSDLRQKVLALAADLSNGFPQGSRMVLLHEPGLDFIVAFWACMCAGMVAVPSYPPGDKRTRERFLGICEDAQAVAVLTTSTVLKKSKLVKFFIASLRRMKWIATDIPSQNTSKLPSIDPEQPALFQYTSGSTSEPKGVVLSQRNILYNARCLDAARSLDGKEDSWVSWTPFYHDMGLMMGVVTPVCMGLFCTLMSPLHFLQKPVRWLQAMTHSQATISAGPNFAFELCLRKVTQEMKKELDLSHWDAALNGAEAIRSSTLKRFSEAFAECGFKPTTFYPCYGLAESTVFASGGSRLEEPFILNVSQKSLQAHQVVFEPEETDTFKAVSLGHSWLDHSFKIVDPETHLETTEVGEVWLQGSSIGQGYWNKPEMTQTQFKAQITHQENLGFFFRTGDYGFERHGQLFLTGRLKEMLIIRGQNYAPDPLEYWAEQSHEALRPGCSVAFSVDIPERAVMVLEVRKVAKSTADDIHLAIRKSVAEHSDLPLDDIVLIEQGTLIKTSSGKRKRKKMAELYLKKKLKRWKSK